MVMETISPSELKKALSADVFDEDGGPHSLLSLVQGKRVIVIFIRWFGCGSCHAYLRHFDLYLPSPKLSPDASVIIVGHGQPASIKAHKEITSTPWPVYTDPTRSIQKALKFNCNAAIPKKGEGREYRQTIGSGNWHMIKLSLRDWFFRYPSLWNKGGHPHLNGGELILDSDGQILHFHRMLNSMDHTDAKDIAQILGITPAEGHRLEATACGTDACERPA